MATAAYYIPDEYKSIYRTSFAPSVASNTGSSNCSKALRLRWIVRFAAIASIILLVVGVGAIVHAFAGDGEVQAASITKHEQVIVKPGDTLWSISETRVQKGEDIRVYIQKLKKLNGVSSSPLQAGQVLLLP